MPQADGGAVVPRPAVSKQPLSALSAAAPSPAGEDIQPFTGKAVKESASRKKRAVKAPKTRINALRRSVRQEVKTADHSAKKIAEATVKARRQAIQAVCTAAKTGASAIREVTSPSVAGIRAAIAAAQELITALAAAGWVVAVIVMMICMAGLLIASPFRVFFADGGNSGTSLSEAETQFNEAFTARIERLKESTVYNTLDLDARALAAVPDNWSNVLTVYAVRASEEGGVSSNVYDLTPKNLALLQETFWDMNRIISFTETIPRRNSAEEVVLHITAVTKTPAEMADEYGFSAAQRELLKPEYQKMFQSLINGGTLTLTDQQVRKILSCLPDGLSQERRQVVLTAYQLLGKVHYFWGGKSLVLGWDSHWGKPKEVWAAGSPSTGTVRPYGLDCSGFVDWVFYNVSGGRYVIGHGGGARMQHSFCTPITWSGALPGDLVFYPNDTHVGIVCGFDEDGNLQIIHCASGRANNVVVTGKSGFTAIARPQYYS